MLARSEFSSEMPIEADVHYFSDANIEDGRELIQAGAHELRQLGDTERGIQYFTDAQKTIVDAHPGVRITFATYAGGLLTKMGCALDANGEPLQNAGQITAVDVREQFGYGLDAVEQSDLAGIPLSRQSRRHTGQLCMYGVVSEEMFRNGDPKMLSEYLRLGRRVERQPELQRSLTMLRGMRQLGAASRLLRLGDGAGATRQRNGAANEMVRLPSPDLTQF